MLSTEYNYAFFLAYDNFQRRAVLKLGGSSSLYRSDAYYTIPDSLLDVDCTTVEFQEIIPLRYFADI